MAIQLITQINSQLMSIASKDAPFAASLALNRTSVGARDQVKGNLPKRFKLRNSWTMGGIQARTSTKNSLIARVLAPDYMGIQEIGGQRKAMQHRMLAAPAEASKSNRVLPKSRRPRGVLADKAFMIDMGGNEAGVFIRYGRARGQIRLLWWLSPDQSYEERFEFERDVNDYVQDRFSSNFLEAWGQVIGEGGYASTGKRGRTKTQRAAGAPRRQHRRTRPV